MDVLASSGRGPLRSRTNIIGRDISDCTPDQVRGDAAVVVQRGGKKGTHSLLTIMGGRASHRKKH